MGLILPGIVAVERDQIAFLIVAGTVALQSQGDPALFSHKFLHILGRNVLAPTGLIVADTAVFHAHMDHTEIVTGRVRIQLGADPADLGDPGAGKPLHDIQIMHTAIHNGRAVLHQPLIAGPVHGMVILHHAHQPQLTNGPAVDQPGNGLVRQVMPQNMGHQHLALRLLHQTAKRLCVFHCPGNGLFAQHMLPGGQAVTQNGKVGIRIGGNDHNIHIRIVQKAPVIGSAVCGAVAVLKLLRQPGITVHHRLYAKFFTKIDVLNMLPADMTAADKQDAIGLHNRGTVSFLRA